MTLKYDKHEDYLVIHLKGEITVGNSLEIKEEIGQLTKQNPCNILLDFEQVTYIDSTGLGTIVAINAAIRKSHKKMGLIGVNQPQIINLLQVTQLNNFFRVYENEITAKGDFSLNG